MFPAFPAACRALDWLPVRVLGLHVAVQVLVQREAEDPAPVGLLSWRQIEAVSPELFAGVVGAFFLLYLQNFHLVQWQAERALRLPFLCLPVLCELLQSVEQAEARLGFGLKYGLHDCLVL